MAVRKKLKLPPLKVTYHPTFGTREVKNIQRGISVTSLDVCGHEEQGTQLQSQSEAPNQSGIVSDNHASCDSSQMFLNLQSNDDELPSLYEIEQRSSVTAWEKLRSGFLSIATECSAMPVDQICLICKSAAVLRCQRCGPSIYYCFDCFSRQHEIANIFHMPEEWKVHSCHLLTVHVLLLYNMHVPTSCI